MSEWFDEVHHRVLAHRGLALDALENSLRAHQAAVALGITHLECDARATRDGVAVLWHDETLERVDGGDDKVAELSLEELAARGKGDWRISTVAEVLEALPHARFNIDVKSRDAVEPLARAIHEAHAEHRVLVCSFDEGRRRAIHRLVPNAATSASGRQLMLAFLALELGWDRFAGRILRGCDALQIPERAAGITLVSPPRLAKWKRHVREIHVWTVNEPSEMRRLWQLGVDGIVTDRADLALQVRSSLERRP